MPPACGSPGRAAPFRSARRLSGGFPSSVPPSFPKEQHVHSRTIHNRIASRLDRQAPAVEVRDLRKTFRRRDRNAGRFARKRPWPALDDVTFTIARGECVAILGQNGSGKSTLVRLLSTLLIDDGGEARIFGHDVVKEASTIRRLVNRVSVEASFFKKMSAAENLSYAARFYGMTPRQTRTAIPEILGKVGFPPERRGESMENLSRGMQQKVALARALLTSPVLLLLDEPTTGLDPRSKLEVQDFIRQVRAEHDATILLCTHDMNEAESLADRIGLLDRGRLLFLEPVDDVKRRFGVETLEQAFFAATGREFEEERRRRRRVQGGVRMSEYAIEMRNQLVGLFGIVERNVYLTKRYILWDVAFMFWTIANTLTIVFIARAAHLPPARRTRWRRRCSSARRSGPSSGSSSSS